MTKTPLISSLSPGGEREEVRGGKRMRFVLVFDIWDLVIVILSHYLIVGICNLVIALWA